MNRTLRSIIKIGSLAAVFVAFASVADAATAGIPWEAPLTTILNSISGPVAKAVAGIIITITGFAMAVGEGGGGARKMLWVVMGLSVAFGATSFFLNFLGYTGGAAF